MYKFMQTDNYRLKEHHQSLTDKEIHIALKKMGFSQKVEIQNAVDDYKEHWKNVNYKKISRRK